jgi:hypothetical protein
LPGRVGCGPCQPCCFPCERQQHPKLPRHVTADLKMDGVAQLVDAIKGTYPASGMRGREMGGLAPREPAGTAVTVCRLPLRGLRLGEGRANPMRRTSTIVSVWRNSYPKTRSPIVLLALRVFLGNKKETRSASSASAATGQVSLRIGRRAQRTTKQIRYVRHYVA